jgi:6,7-dimethyl-8-ribityllumazine synthase
MKFGIVVSDWNSEITFALLEGAVNTLIKHGTLRENIIVRHVPGSFELTFGAKHIAEEQDVDAVICLGCVIQGETPHFNYICQGVSMGITQLNIDYNLPFVFGVLTTSNLQQAKERAGGKHGNKGDEAAITAIKMVAMNQGE